MKGMSLNVRITGLREFAVRRAVAFFLFRLAADILGCGIEIEPDAIEGERPPPPDIKPDPKTMMVVHSW